MKKIFALVASAGLALAACDDYNEERYGALNTSIQNLEAVNDRWEEEAKRWDNAHDSLHKAVNTDGERADSLEDGMKAEHERLNDEFKSLITGHDEAINSYKDLAKKYHDKELKTAFVQEEAKKLDERLADYNKKHDEFVARHQKMLQDHQAQLAALPQDNKGKRR